MKWGIQEISYSASEEKINDIGDDRYKDSAHFSDAEKAL